MDFLERWLNSRPLILCLGLGLLTALLLGGYGVVGPDAIPFGDGQRYAIRAFTLYGYLHSGQWARFWDLLTFDKWDTLAPLHYWIFFLLPQSLAGITAYGAILGLTTYLLLAFGCWAWCDALGRKEWGPLLFLLCSAQNLSLDFTYYYFCDVPFLALGTVVLAAQVRAWRQGRFSASVLAGALAALLFLVKPANAVIFAGTFVLAEALHAGIEAWTGPRGGETGHGPEQNLRRHLAGIALGFFPILLLILPCGALQTIMLLIDANETSNLFTTRLDCTGLTRLFYFPLCLSYFYYALLVMMIAAIVVMATLWRLYRLRVLPPVAAIGPFPWRCLLPVLIAYLILGEYFSLGMNTKTMRSLLLVLPPLWLLVFWGAERFRVRLATLFLGIASYVVCAYAHIYFEIFPYGYVAPESYQIDAGWPARFPSPIFNNQYGPKATRFLLAYVHHFYPAGGTLAIGSERMFYTAESLAWLENSDLLLRNRPPVYHFSNFLQPDGSYVRRGIVGANGVMVYTLQPLQYSKEVYQGSCNFIIHSRDQWQNRDHLATLVPLVAVPRPGAEVVLGCLIVFKSPMTEKQVDDVIAATHAPGYAVEEEQFADRHDKPLTWVECRDILVRWARKHFGSSPPPTPP